MTESSPSDRSSGTRFDTVVANTGAGAVGEVADLGLRTVGSLLLARILGPAGLGSWLVARTVAFDLTSIVARCGLDEGVLRFVARSRGRREPSHARGVVRTGLRWSTITAAVAVGLIVTVSTPVARGVFGKPEVAGLMRVVVPSLLVWAPVAVLLSAVQGADCLAIRVAAQKIALPGFQAVVLAAALAGGWGLGGVVAAHYAGILAMAVVAVRAGLPAWRKAVGTGAGSCGKRELAEFAGPVALSELSTFVVLWIDILMLGALSSRDQTGIYGAAQRVAGLVALPLNAVNLMFSPMIASLHGRGDMPALSEMFKTTTRWVLLASIPPFVLIAFTGPGILGLFGKDFSVGAMALLVLSAGKLVSSATGSVGYMLNMTGHQRLNLVNSLILGVVNATLNAFWIVRWGAVGAAAASALSLGVVNIIRVIEVRAVLKLNLLSRGYAVIGLAGILGVVAVCGLRQVLHGWSGGVLCAGLFVAVYGGVIGRWGIDEVDRKAATAVFRRFR